MTKVLVNQVIPFSTADGLGSRTFTFLRKCSIACGYCHNPETQNLCNSCGACVPRCSGGAFSMADGVVVRDKSKCASCNTRIEVCPYHVSPKIRWVDAPVVMKEVEKNIPFIRRIIVSGGECGLYSQFLQGLFTLARAKGLIYLLDNNGIVRSSKHPELTKVCDDVMLDVKTWSPGVFRALAGGDNAAVKKNLLFLSSCGKFEEVCIVNVEGHVDAEGTIRSTTELPGPLTDNTCPLLTPFRNNGVKGPFAALFSPSVERMKQLMELTASTGFRNIIVRQWQAAVLRQLQNQCALTQMVHSEK